MEEYPDLGCELEPEDYSVYEDKYADDLEMVNEIESDDAVHVDFDVFTHHKRPSPVDFAYGAHHDSTMNEDDFDSEKYVRKSAKRSISQLAESEYEVCLTSKEDRAKICSKKPRTEKNAEILSVLDKVDKIIEKLKCDVTSSDVSKGMERRRVFRRPVFGEDSLNVTSSDGDRVFLRISPDSMEFLQQEPCWASRSPAALNLLAVPFHELRAEVEEKRHQQAVARLSRADGGIVTNLSDAGEVISPSAELWVDKYAPKSYMELLSDDGTNRVLLQWLKLWDAFVFKRSTKPLTRKPACRKDGPTSKQAHSQPTVDGKRKFPKKLPWDYEEDLVVDSSGRPKHKIALLCGNPGLGKTTLAHVIAKHAGYNVVEMNASDDRSPELFLEKIEAATQMKAVIGHDTRPNCLVIDEIDGAPVQAINILIDLVKQSEQVTTRDKGTKEKKGRKKKNRLNLTRPIVCICNDQYVPALRLLRQVALTLQFPATIPGRLACRLLEISRQESMRIDMGTLLALSDKTEHDIRSCINTLQFIQQRSADFKPEDIYAMDVGQKDMKKGLRMILHEIFQLPRTNKRKFIGKLPRSSFVSNSGAPKTSASARFHYMLHLASSDTDLDKVVQGLFEHYLLAKTKDPFLESVKLGTDWLVFSDLLEKQISQSQDYVLMKFSPFLPVAFHMYFARATAPKTGSVNVSFEMYQKRMHNEQTLQLMTSNVLPHIRRNLLGPDTVVDLVPYLFLATLPNLRPVNTQLYSTSEKQMFANLIGTMISYNLTYRQERNTEGQYTYLLDPNIEELTQFSGLPQHRHLPYPTKQLIAREVDLEKMRRAARVTKASEQANSSAVRGVQNASQNDAARSQKLEPRKPRLAKEKPHLDFFGRVVLPKELSVDDGASTSDERLASTEPPLLNTRLWFKFNEGYTNAVRRTVKIHEFL